MRRILFLVPLLLLISMMVLGQPGNPPPDPDVPVPIPGIPLLLLLGAILGVKNLIKRRFKDKF